MLVATGSWRLSICELAKSVRGPGKVEIVAEQGTHATLMAKGGLYARLAGSQDLETVAS